MENEKIIFSINFSEEELQEFAENNFDRKLTDMELNRIHEYWYECEEVRGLRDDIVFNAIKDALDTKNNNWSGVDADYIKEQQKSDEK